MKATDLTRAIASARSAASAAGLAAAEAVILQNSNKLSLRLLPCDTLARVSLDGEATAQFEVDLAAALSRAGGPSGALDPRVSPGVYLHDGFAVTFWTYYEQSQAEIPPADYADALLKLHASMRALEIPAPRYTDRVDDARRLLQDQAKTPDLSGDDRAFLNAMLRRITRDIADRSAPEQLLHGEPHAGNVLNTFFGPLLIDLETCCRGPIEFDLAHVPGGRNFARQMPRPRADYGGSLALGC